MLNKYRVDWQAGMRLTDETFRLSDEYFLSCLQPLYAVLVNGDYGFLDIPIFRYELSETAMSVTELRANALTRSGKLIRMSFSREEFNRFQNISLPKATDPIIVFIDKTSEQNVRLTDENAVVPLCDDDYEIIIRPESEHYNNPDAVPLARLVYNYGWCLDSAFIAPCISLSANGVLLRSAANYVVELEQLIKAMQEARDTEESLFIISVLPLLTAINVELQQEADAMRPRHLIALMQKVVSLLLSVASLDERIEIPEKTRCVSFVESHYTPYVISQMVNEGIILTHMMINMVGAFHCKSIQPVYEPVEAPRTQAPRRIDTTSIRKKFH